MSFLNITPSDFEGGVYNIATNVHTESDLQSYIDLYEEKYLKDLLGCALFDLFKADVVNGGTGIPIAQIYLDIYNAFCEENDCYRYESEGMLVMLKDFIYFEYTRDQPIKNTNSGNRVNDNEASREAEFSETKIYRLYNQGINSYRAIQWYICDNLTVYPTMKGIIKGKTSWL